MIATTIMSSIRVKPPCRRDTGLCCCCIVVPCLADVEAVVETVGVMFSIVPSVVSLFMLMLSLRSRYLTFTLSLRSFCLAFLSLAFRLLLSATSGGRAVPKPVEPCRTARKLAPARIHKFTVDDIRLRYRQIAKNT